MAKRPAEILTRTEVQALLRTYSPKFFSPCRDRALVALLYCSAIRIQEACSLYPDDVSRDLACIRVRKGKGGRSRTAPLHPSAWAHLDPWLNKRRELSNGGAIPLFCTHAGLELDPRNFRTALATHARKAGITKRVHPHAFRATCATERLREGWTVEEIRVLLGHKNLKHTLAYLEELFPLHVIEKMRRTGSLLDSG